MSVVDPRQPDLEVTLNGVTLDGVFEAEVSSNAYLGADRFEFRAALTASNRSVWSSSPLSVEIRAGLNGAWQSLITGEADSLELDPLSGEVRVGGRDLTALLIASQTQESFENLTASDVALLMADRHGLSPAVTPTRDLTGRYYQSSHTRTALSQHGRATTEWDILSWLAQQAGYEVWVQGRSLYFQPPAPTATGLTLTPQACLEMRLNRDLTVAAGFIVQVQSWNCASQQMIQQSSTYGAPVPGARPITTLRPNLSSNDALTLAQRVATQLGTHERRISYGTVADLITMPRVEIELQSTQTDFDGKYVVYEVERRFSMQRGFTQHVVARRASWTIS